MHRLLTGSLCQPLVALTGVCLISLSGCSQGSQWVQKNNSEVQSPIVAVEHDEAGGQIVDLQGRPRSARDTMLTSYSDNRSPAGPGPALQDAASSAPGVTAADHFFLPDSNSVVETLSTLEPDEALEDRLKSTDGIVLVDFYADWCGPCRRQSKILHDIKPLAQQNNARIIKVNVDQHRELSQKFGVTSLPTLIAFRNGQVIQKRRGLSDEKQLGQMLRM